MKNECEVKNCLYNYEGESCHLETRTMKYFNSPLESATFTCESFVRFPKDREITVNVHIEQPSFDPRTFMENYLIPALQEELKKGG